MGILDKELSCRLQLMANFTLADTIQGVQQSKKVDLQVRQQGDIYTAVQEVQGKVADRGKKPSGNLKGKIRMTRETQNVEEVGKYSKKTKKNVQPRTQHVTSVRKWFIGKEMSQQNSYRSDRGDCFSDTLFAGCSYQH